MDLLFLALALGLVYGAFTFWPAGTLARRIWAVAAVIVAVLLVIEFVWPGTIE